MNSSSGKRSPRSRSRSRTETKVAARSRRPGGGGSSGGSGFVDDAPEYEGVVSAMSIWAGRLATFVMLGIAPWWMASVWRLPQFVLIVLAMVQLMLVWVSYSFGRPARRTFPWLALPVLLGVALLIGQTVPLSEDVASVVASTQQEMYATYGAPAAGELLVTDESPDPVVRATMDLDGSRHAIVLLTLGLVSLVATAGLFAGRHAAMLIPFVMTINGVCISAYGILQRVKGERRVFGSYELDHGGNPFGPFVNENNAAGFLLICMGCSIGLLVLAFSPRRQSGQRPRPIITREYPIWQRARLHLGLFIADLDATRLIAMMATALIAAGVTATLSRSGFAAMIIALAVTGVLFSVLRQSFGAVLLGGVLALAAAGLVGWFGLGEKLMRDMAKVSETDFVDREVRMQHWTQTSPAIGDFFPAGSGAGSYDNVHRLYRVDSEDRIFVYAENQYFQTLVEVGWGGLVLLLAAIGLLGFAIWILATKGSSTRTFALAMTGIFVLTTQVITSMFDFAHYIPANLVAMAVVSGLISGQAHALAGRLKEASLPGLRFPELTVMALLLLVIALGVYATLDADRFRRIEHVATGWEPQRETFETTDLTKTENRIEAMKAVLENSPDADGFRLLGELYILRYRLQLFDRLKRQLPSARLLDAEAVERTWLATSLDRLNAAIHAAVSRGQLGRAEAMREDDLVRDSLYQAVWYLQRSRERSPLQPNVHLILGQLHAVAPDPNADQPHLARACALAPSNAATRFIAGLMDLQAGRLESACDNLRRCLQIDSRFFSRVVAAVEAALPPARIVNDILPEDPQMLYRFASSHLSAQSLESLKLDAFKRARELLILENNEDRKSLQILAEIELALGDSEAAAETLRRAIDLNPEIRRLRMDLIRLLIAKEQFDEALEEIKWMRGLGDETESLIELRNRILQLRDKKLFR